MTTTGALTDWASLAGRLDTPTELLIDGQWVPALDGKRLDVVSPIDGSVILSFPTFEEAKAWYNSPAYTEARQHRHLGADYRCFITEGV